MIFTKFKDLEEMSSAAAAFMYAQIKEDQDFTICPAAGTTPALSYRYFVEKMQHHKKGNLRLMMLDEWMGLPHDHPASCRHQIDNQLIKPLSIQQYFAFDCSNDPESEIARFRKSGVRSLDLCILGLGENGHIGLNEPAKSLRPHCHKAHLSTKSQNHAMIQDIDPKPKYGITLGMQEILASTTILLLVNGKSKKDAFLKLGAKNIDTYCPASLLWLHPNTHCYHTEDVIA